MQNIYLAHSTDGDYQKDLYLPIKKNSLNLPYRIILPHSTDCAPADSRHAIGTSVLVVAEVSQPSLGVGIELGWASYLKVPILAIHKIGTPVSQSVNFVAKKIIEYKNAKEIPTIINDYLK